MEFRIYGVKNIVCFGHSKLPDKVDGTAQLLKIMFARSGAARKYGVVAIFQKPANEKLMRSGSFLGINLAPETTLRNPGETPGEPNLLSPNRPTHAF